ncbi:hypothetical protein Tco_0131035, partial [Tanacetum coccineum]
STSQVYKYVCGPHASALEDSGSLHQHKCLSGKTPSNDKLRKSRIDILREKKSRHENMSYPRFTKVIIDYFLSKHKSLKKLKFQHFHTIKDDSVKSKGKGSQGKKTADTTEESVDVSDESDLKTLIRRKTSRRKLLRRKPPYQLMTTSFLNQM